MMLLALRTVRHRPAAVLAAFLSSALGATLVMAFAAMLDTANGPAVDTASRETLTTMAGIVGGWSLIIVVFAVASTLGLRVRQRAGELALLRATGATPAQVRRLIVGEALPVAVAAILVAVLPAWLGGRVLLEVLQDTGQVADRVDYAFGSIALAVGAAVTIVAATLAALLTALRAGRLRAREALADAALEPSRLSRKRIAAATLFLLLALDLAVVTGTVFYDTGVDAMQTSGQASIWAAIGLALLAPALIRRALGTLERPLQRAGLPGEIAATNLRERTAAMSRTLMPVILFTAIATGTLYLQATENSVPFQSSGGITPAEADNIQTLNLVVVAMIGLFAAIMLVNTILAATSDRRRELAQLRLAGLSPRQVLAVVALEGTVLALIGILAGTIASAFTVLPFSFARTGTPIPDVTPLLWIAVAGLAAALTLVTSLGAARATIRPPAIRAVEP